MEQESIEPSDSLAGFPEAVQEDVEGLTWLGYLEDEFEFCGHHFVIRTLRGNEELLAGLVSKEFAESVGQDKAYTWATIALALVSVDGDEDFCPPAGRDKKAYARARYQYCSDRWFWGTAVAIWAHHVDLLRRQAEAFQAVEDLFSGSLPSFTPSVDSLIDRASSEEDPQEDIRDYLDDLESSKKDS